VSKESKDLTCPILPIWTSTLLKDQILVFGSTYFEREFSK